MKTLTLIALLLLPLIAHATPTQDTTISVNLFPHTRYNVTADVTTSDPAALIALLSNGQSPLQILDEAGHLLGEVPAQDLIDQLTGATGTVTRQIQTTIDTAAKPLDTLTTRALDSNLLQIGSVKVTAASDQGPTVKITRAKKTGAFARIRGTATDDQKVARVEVITNGQLRRAHGTTTWKIRVALKPGTNRITVRAFDNADRTSPPRRIKMRG